MLVAMVVEKEIVPASGEHAFAWNYGGGVTSWLSLVQKRTLICLGTVFKTLYIR